MILAYDWDFGSVLKFYPLLLRGVAVTLALTGLSIGIGSALGGVLGVLLLSRLSWVRIPLQLTVDAVRAMPPLVLLIWVYYFVPVLIGVPGMGAFWLAVIAFSVNLAAFVADVTRASIVAYPKNLIDAAIASGITPSRTMFRLILPDVLREAVPALVVLYIGVLKMTSLASVITVHELVHAADQIRIETFNVLETYTVLGAMYLAIVMPLAAWARRLERTPWLVRR